MITESMVNKAVSECSDGFKVITNGYSFYVYNPSNVTVTDTYFEYVDNTGVVDLVSFHDVIRLRYHKKEE